MKSKLVPYVDIIIRPKHRKRYPQRSRSPSPIVDTPDDNSPRKRRKLQKNDSVGGKLSSKLIQITPERQISPTASDYTFDSTVLPTSHSQTTSCGDTYAHDNPFSSSDQAGPSSMPFNNENPLYETFNDEIMEDEDLFVAGETPVLEDEGDIPVRILQNFSIYNMETFALVSVAELLELQFSQSTFGSSGMVKPWIDDPDDGSNASDTSSNSSEDGDYVKLSKILELNIHDLSDDGKNLDSKIYIRTKFAWYILGIPDASYAPFYAPFWTQHRILHVLVTMSLENKRTTYKDLIDNLKQMDSLDDSIATARLVIGRELGKTDIETNDVRAYVLATLPELCSQNGIRISRVPVVKEIMGSAHYDFDDVETRPRRPYVARKKISSRNQETEVLKHSSNTFLTPIVNHIAQRFFEGSLEVSAPYDMLDEASASLRDHKDHPLNPQKLVLSNPLVKGEDVFGNVTIDGTRYKAGDIVMVEPDLNYKSGGKPNATRTVNKYGNRWWFCQIRYFFQKSDRSHVSTMFHGQWFTHGCKTILQETSHSKALYFLDTCDDNYISAIYKKCNIKILKPGDEEQVDDTSHDANDFHCGLMYDEEHVSFHDLPKDALTVFDYKSCHSCDSRATEAQLEKDVLTDIGVVHHGIHYHHDDFVFIHPSDHQSKLLDIGQIIKFKGKLPMLEIHIQLLGRYDEYVVQQKGRLEDPELASDERRLFYRLGISTISIDQLDGICHVQHLTDTNQIEAWVKHDNHFFLNQEGDEDGLLVIKRRDFTFCEQCHKDDQETIHKTDQFLCENSKLTGMELFSGAGGLGIGMNLSGFVETKYAVEFSPSAAKTYKSDNHPETMIYCQDSSTLLKHAVAQSNNEYPAPLLSNDRKTFCPNMPDKNASIDFIFGGPPCQSFSRANYSKKQNDIRSTLPCNMLSYVEHYEPDYFLLENVAGLLDHRLLDKRTTNAGVATEDYEIQSGMVKFILTTLIALGYQVHYKLLQAAQYGVPQSRNRVIFWGAKRGVPLPQFPVPMYAFPTGTTRPMLPTGSKLPPPSRSKAPGDFHHYAPLRPISVNDAICDLPPFDWKNPHLVLPEKAKNRVEAKRRQKQGILQINAAFEPRSSQTDNPGYPQGASYATPPQNRYQKWLRNGMDEDELVMGHYTRRFAAHIIETTVNVPLKPMADHRDVPSVLLPTYAKPNSRKPGITYFGRMDGDKHFRCATTQVAPGLKSSWPLHPSQKRIITVRECARAQGFPDSYVFKSINTDPSKVVQDQTRQIGNAVAVPFALALGKELGKAMVKRWEKKKREGSVVL